MARFNSVCCRSMIRFLPCLANAQLGSREITAFSVSPFIGAPPFCNSFTLDKSNSSIRGLLESITAMGGTIVNDSTCRNIILYN